MHEVEKIPVWKQVLYISIAPFIIGAWCITHPKEVWKQAKKDYNL